MNNIIEKSKTYDREGPFDHRLTIRVPKRMYDKHMVIMDKVNLTYESYGIEPLTEMEYFRMILEYGLEV